MTIIRRKQVTADQVSDRNRNYFCRTCCKRYTAHEILVDVEGGRQHAWWCPKAHAAKLIPYSPLPCPICGQVTKDYKGNAKPVREEGMPCPKCLAEFNRTKAAIAALDKESTGLQDRGIPHAASLPEYGSFDDRDAIGLRASFVAVMTLLGRPSHRMSGWDVPSLIGTDKGRECSEVRKYSPEQISAINKLYDAIVRTCAVAELQGKERGESFIQQLCAGEISVQDMNQHVLDNRHTYIVDRLFEIATKGKQLKDGEERALRYDLSRALRT
jgi:uncharacterized C2H2 Zn-finger protein